MLVILEIVKGMFSQASILVGMIAMVGLIALKKPFANIVSGTLKTIIGWIILSAGATVVSGVTGYLGDLFIAVLNIPNAALPVNEVFSALVQQDAVLGPMVAWVFLGAFIVNILIALLTKWKYIYLTGHVILFNSVLTVAMFSLMPPIASSPLLVIVLSSVITGITMVLFPTLSAPFMEKIIGSKDFVLGHPGTIAYATSGFLGQFVGKKEDDSEKIKFPAWIGFMREPLVAMGFIMLIIFVVISLIGMSKGVNVEEILGSPWWLQCFIQALTFAGGIGVILLGVRSVLAEIVPAFRGISEKIVPNAVPALDCPVVFPYAQNALLLGYLSSIAGGLVVMFIQIASGGALGGVILPSMIVHFFCGGTAGIFGNSTGGWKGAVLGGIINGVMFTFLAGLVYTSLAGLNPAWAGSSFGDTDLGFIGSILGYISTLIK